MPSNAPANRFDKQQISTRIHEVLIEQFDVEPADLRPGAHLADDLGIDSIDAVDLIVRLREITGVKVPAELFKDVRTVGDVEGVIETLLEQQS